MGEGACEGGGDGVVGVRALVMVRDDATGGWLPMGGGLAHVSVVANDHSTDRHHSILARRIADHATVLHCRIDHDFRYNKVMPTFHHWLAERQRFGLTFQTAADARAFDKAVRHALHRLLDDDANIFECLNLPSDSRSSSENSTAERPTVVNPTQPKRAPVQLYPEPLPLLGFRTQPPRLPPSPPKKPPERRLKCRHCHEWYADAANRPGVCRYAPDRLESCVNAVACVACASCMLYHCCSDAEGDFVSHPCSCDSTDRTKTKRWIGLAFLSMLVPCLWCYPPLKAMHWCCVGCGVSGGKHAPLQHSLSAFHR